MGKKGHDGKKPPEKEPKDLVSEDQMAVLSNCSPVLEWNSVRLPDTPMLTYDVSVHEGVKYKSHQYSRGKLVYSKSDYPITSVSVVPPLKPKSVYFWSIRVRKPDGQLSQWSTNSKTVKRPAVPGEYTGHWHGMITPENCEAPK